jgi:hypothetical protein
MLNKFIALIFLGAFTIGSGFAADIVVKERPPKAISERRGHAPGKDYVWIPGFHRWENNHYTWEKGRWDRPPHAHARWIAPRWEHRRDGYVFVEGHWS